MTIRRPAPTNKNFIPERETPLQSHYIAQEVHKERQREIERRLWLRSEHRAQIRRRSLRRRLGLGLIQFGSMLAADPTLQPVTGR
jgi:hypothetical protein